MYHLGRTEVIMLEIELSDSQTKAIRRLVAMLESAQACYQFTGGFAGNLHGSRWPLHDLDVDVAQADLPRLCPLFSAWTTRPLGRYEDDEFDLQLLCLELEGIRIDISQAEDAYARQDGLWVPLGTTLANRLRTPLFDFAVWVQPLNELIAYKTILGRSADLVELRALQT
jgi:hypothetical protein